MLHESVNHCLFIKGMEMKSAQGQIYLYVTK